jgi:ribosomal protein S18 acetylase RimI-like enzyme
MSLVQAIEDNFFAIGRYWGNLNASLLNADYIYSMSTGISSSDLNWAWNEKPLTTQKAKDISRVRTHYEKLALPFWWWVYPSGQSRGLEILFGQEDIHLFSRIPCLGIDLSIKSNILSPPARDLKISPVKNNTDLVLWGKLSFAGFEMPAETENQYLRFVRSFDVSASAPQKLFYISFEGKPSASFLLFFHNKVAGIYFVSTLPGKRRSGIGLALTMLAINYARDAGCKYCILQSSESGIHIYIRAGFQEYCLADIYSHPIS